MTSDDIEKIAIESFEINKSFIVSENHTIKDLYKMGYFQGFLRGMKEVFQEQQQENEELQRKWLDSDYEKAKLVIENERAKILLKATLDLLQKQKESYYVLNLLEQTSFYDKAECDGYCLFDDIENFIK